MKIEIEKNIVRVTPEEGRESKELEALWKLLVDCEGLSKKLAPIGEFVPVKKNEARFVIE